MEFGEIAMKIGFYTLGCKTNQYETQAMEQLLRVERDMKRKQDRLDGEMRALAEREGE